MFSVLAGTFNVASRSEAIGALASAHYASRFSRLVARLRRR